MSNEELVMKIKSAGGQDPDTMMELFRQNIKLVMYAIRPFSMYSEEADAPGDFWCLDLQHEAFLSLYEAVDYYRPDAGAKFSTVFLRFLRKKLKQIAAGFSGVRVSEDRALEVRRYRTATKQLREDLGREPSEDELLEELGYGTREFLHSVQKTVAIMNQLRLDEPVKGADGNEARTLGDLQPDPGQNVEEDVVGRITEEEVRTELWMAVDDLPERQAEVLRRQYQDEETVQEIADNMDISRQRVSVLSREGRRGIRESRRGRRLRLVLDLPIWEKQNPFIAVGFGSWKRSGFSRTERLAIWEVDGCI